jgi:hypothetical protein
MLLSSIADLESCSVRSRETLDRGFELFDRSV